MHARSIHSRMAAKALVRPRNPLIEALNSVLEPLEQRTMLSAGDFLGSVTTDLGGSPDQGGYIVRLPGESNHLLQVGTRSTINPETLNSETVFSLAEFDEDGALVSQSTAALPCELSGVGDCDPPTTVYELTNTSVAAVAVYQSGPHAGRIIVVGSANDDTHANPDFMVAAFTPGGALDTSFGTGGVTVTNFRSQPAIPELDQPELFFPNGARAVAIQDDGKIIVAGVDEYNGSSDGFAVARYNNDGSWDTAFSSDDADGIDGVAEYSFRSANTFVAPTCTSNSTDELYAVALDQNQNIVVAGSTFVPGGQEFGCDFAPYIGLQRFTSSGVLDTSFSSDGIVIKDITLAAAPVTGDIAYSVAVDQNNNILVGGTTDSPVLSSSQDLLLMRYLDDGTLDLSFSPDGDGIATTSFDSVSDFWALGRIDDIAVQSDNKILVSGSVVLCDDSECSSFSTNFLVGRYISDPESNAGSLDSSFVGTPASPLPGIVFYNTNSDLSGNNYTVTLAIQNKPSGQEAAIGTWVFGSGLDTGDFFLSRYDLAVASPTSGGSTSVAFDAPTTTANEGDILSYHAVFTSGGGGGGSGIAFFQEQHRAEEGAGGGGGGGSVSYTYEITLEAGAIDPVVASGFGSTMDGFENIPFTPADDGLYHISIIINDGEDSASVDVNVANVAPTIAISGNASVNEGSSYSLTLGAVTDPGTDTVTSYIVHWGDGNTDTYPSNGVKTHTYADGLSNPSITVDLMDEDGTFANAANPFSVTVNNVAPTIAIGGAGSLNEGGSYSLTLGTVTDPGTDTVSSYIVHWGDGNTSTFASNGVKTHTYADGPSTNNITVDLVDEDGTFLNRANALSVTVNNVAPTIAISGAGSVSEGSSYNLTLGPVTDPGQDTVSSYIVHWGDGNTSTFASNGVKTHTYVEGPNSYNITVDLVDEDGTFLNRANALSVTVNNVAPSVAAISGPSTGVQLFTQSFSSSFTDPGSTDTWTVTWNFGDGNTQTSAGSPGALSASHVYTATGTYTVTLTVADDDGGSNSQTRSITIADAAIVGGSLQVGGTGGADTINVNPGSGSNTDVSVNGHSTTWGGFSQIVVMAGNGNDTVKVNPNVNSSVVVFGGAGNDSIKGGGGTDILIGDDGNDLLQGQDGRDILIGGDGQDSIVGQTDDDILVAGFSNYDDNLSALNSILAEWTSGRSYGQRSANIIGHNITIGSTTYTFSGTRNNSSIFLTPYDSSTPSAPATVFDDQDVDVLTGNAGQDLFLFNADNPVPDTITDLSSSEFAADLDFLNNP